MIEMLLCGEVPKYILKEKLIRSTDLVKGKTKTPLMLVFGCCVSSVVLESSMMVSQLWVAFS